MTRQLGSSSDDYSTGVSADGWGNVYISGYTLGSLDGPNQGLDDAFVSKYSASGTLEWTRQLGSSSSDYGRGVSADGLGSVYISGYTKGGLDGRNHGSWDAFVSKYDASGTLEWTRQLGTSSSDRSLGVSADDLGNVYISGYTLGDLDGSSHGSADALLSKYDASGTLEWTRQLGSSSSDYSTGVSADGWGNVYISGYTLGSLDGPNQGLDDAFVSKYSASGTLEWTRQLGSSSSDYSTGVSADGLGSVYISGYTKGGLDGRNHGSWDAFVSKYDASGTLEWTRQLGTSSSDRSFGVSTDDLGNVYISGYTLGDLDGSSHGSVDAFLSKYDADGTLEWTRQLGSSSPDYAAGVSADGLRNVHISGHTEGDLDGPNQGGIDAFAAFVVPEPSSQALLFTGLLLISRRVRRVRQA